MWDQTHWKMAMVIQSLLALWAVEPLTGESFFYQFSHVNKDCYQKYLEELSKAYSDSLNMKASG
jgi:hypothetical protein